MGPFPGRFGQVFIADDEAHSGGGIAAIGPGWDSQLERRACPPFLCPPFPRSGDGDRDLSAEALAKAEAVEGAREQRLSGNIQPRVNSGQRQSWARPPPPI